MILYEGKKMVPMMKDNRDILSVPRLLMAAPDGGFQYYVHYAGDRYGTINTINVKEVWPNAFNDALERSNGGGISLKTVGNIGTLLYSPAIQYMPSAGHINGTGSVRAESAIYSNGKFTPTTLGMSSAFKRVEYTQTNEVSWPYNEKWRLQVGGSFYDQDAVQFKAFAYYLINVYNMDLSLGTNPFRWNIYSNYRENGVVKTGENNVSQDVTTHLVIDGVSYKAWLIKTEIQSDNYSFWPDNPYQPTYPDLIYRLQYVDMPSLMIDVTTDTGWFQVTSMGMEFWCHQYVA